MELVAAQSTAGRQSKVQFEPFVGVAPRRYLELFDALSRERWGHPKRKNKQGETIDFSALMSTANPVFSDLRAVGIASDCPDIPASRTQSC
jgi:hypothetical protein